MSSGGPSPSPEPKRSGEPIQREPIQREPTQSEPTQSEPAQSPRSRELLAEIARYAADKKAGEVVELDLRDVLGYTDWFLICTGNTERQTKAIHDAILEGCKREHGTLPRRVEGFSRGDWILMDYLDVVAHIFTPVTREYYRLEQLWGEAPARAVGAGTA